jgi:hypothetical protein
MKTRKGFVSNSSSTSFIIGTAPELTDAEKALKQEVKAAKMTAFRRTVLQWLWDGKMIVLDEPERGGYWDGYWQLDYKTMRVIKTTPDDVDYFSITEFWEAYYDCQFKVREEEAPPMPQ